MEARQALAVAFIHNQPQQKRRLVPVSQAFAADVFIHIRAALGLEASRVWESRVSAAHVSRTDCKYQLRCAIDCMLQAVEDVDLTMQNSATNDAAERARFLLEQWLDITAWFDVRPSTCLLLILLTAKLMKYM